MCVHIYVANVAKNISDRQGQREVTIFFASFSQNPDVLRQIESRICFFLESNSMSKTIEQISVAKILLKFVQLELALYSIDGVPKEE